MRVLDFWLGVRVRLVFRKFIKGVGSAGGGLKPEAIMHEQILSTLRLEKNPDTLAIPKVGSNH